MAKKKAPKVDLDVTNVDTGPKPKKGLSIEVNLTEEVNFGHKLKVMVSLLQDGVVISEDEDFVTLPLTTKKK